MSSDRPQHMRAIRFPKASRRRATTWSVDVCRVEDAPRGARASRRRALGCGVGRWHLIEYGVPRISASPQAATAPLRYRFDIQHPVPSIEHKA